MPVPVPVAAGCVALQRPAGVGEGRQPQGQAAGQPGRQPLPRVQGLRARAVEPDASATAAQAGFCSVWVVAAASLTDSQASFPELVWMFVELRVHKVLSCAVLAAAMCSRQQWAHGLFLGIRYLHQGSPQQRACSLGCGADHSIGLQLVPWHTGTLCCVDLLTVHQHKDTLPEQKCSPSNGLLWLVQNRCLQVWWARRVGSGDVHHPT